MTKSEALTKLLAAEAEFLTACGWIPHQHPEDQGVEWLDPVHKKLRDQQSALIRARSRMRVNPFDTWLINALRMLARRTFPPIQVLGTG